MEIPSIDNLNSNTIRVKYISKYYPEFYNFLNDKYKDCKNLSEKLYLYYNNLDKRPACIICGHEVKFEGFFRGFRKHCCSKCSYKDPIRNLKTKQTNLERYGYVSSAQNENVKEKAKRTCLERYGVDNPMKNKIIREKSKQTNLERYGYISSAQNENVKEKAKRTCLERYGCISSTQNEEIKEKIKQTNLERYGYISSAQNENVKEKAKRTCLERYGCISSAQNNDIKNKQKQTIRESNIESHPDLLRYVENGDWICKCPHSECNKCFEKEYIISQQVYYNRKRLGSELCTKLLPIQPPYSTPELQIRNFLDSLNIKYITNDRSIIPPKELDIYIPPRNIAIEFNGSYWHSNKDKYYHQNKTKACYSRGILLIHIYEHEWNANKESILSKLKDLLEGKEVNGIVSVKDYDKYTLSEPVLIDCGSCKIWNEGEWIVKS